MAPKTKLAPFQKKFLDDLAGKGGPVATGNDLPISVMLSVASIESMWGTSKIYKKTNNPFSLQKWPHIPFPTTHNSYKSDTVINEETRATKTVFYNCALGFDDAVRQWCEWILHWGEADGPPQDMDKKIPLTAHPPAIANRTRLLSLRKDPLAFASSLPLVGYGDMSSPAAQTKSGSLYKDRIRQFSMTDYDP